MCKDAWPHVRVLSEVHLEGRDCVTATGASLGSTRRLVICVPFVQRDGRGWVGFDLL